ncbi:Protein of unknown function [Cognatiyoonia sediminum]|uniref:DUF2842 domain-containing protein n=1 Tax=Cognatiyoonia sediminum TaxID=1508389 RepID=A0A1M5L422_9RHOB|nr:DUF2842 domain-containing protein [Cognatiyoonia sediminum]SHG59842.1 Protein of unknown function [Cognatiyoonia sediminum]
MTYKGRKRLSLLILVVGVPAYIMLAVTVMSTAPRFPLVIEFFLYVGLGIGWVFPLKWVFKGIGQPDPDQ